MSGGQRSRNTILALAATLTVGACADQGRGPSGGATPSGDAANAGTARGGDGASAGWASTPRGGAGSGGRADAAASGGITAQGGAESGSSGGTSGVPAGGAGGRAGATAQTVAGMGGKQPTAGASTSGGQHGAGAPASGGNGGAGRGAGGAAAGAGQAGAAGRSIAFGTLLDAQAVVSAAQTLAKSLAQPSSPVWRAKGDQHRTYRFADADTNEPYRISVPTSWDGQSVLPLVVFLHGSGSDENTYVDQNNQQLLKLAEQHGYLLVSPLGDKGAYGNFLRLSAPFGDEKDAAELMTQVTADSEKTNELSEQDVINVLEIVLNEYPIDRDALFLAGHSMGSGGTWYIGGKYASYWHALAPMSGPFVQETGYPWDSLRATPLFVTEGTQTPSVDASRLLRDWLSQNHFDSSYLEVDADHGGMIPLVLPQVFDFFDGSR